MKDERPLRPVPPSRRERKRRRRVYDERAANRPPASADDGSWSGRKVLLVLSALLGIPAVLLVIFGRSDVLRAAAAAVAVLAIIAARIFLISGIQRNWDD